MNKYIIGAVFSFALLASPFTTYAAGLTSSQIRSIIQLLQSFGADQSVISNVQTALGGTQTPETGAWCYSFTKDLKIGDNDGYGSLYPHVTDLHVALKREGFSILDSELGLNGKGIGVFGESTASAVSGFQEKYASTVLTPNGLQHGTGYVGVSTRAKLNQLYGCSNQTSQP